MKKWFPRFIRERLSRLLFRLIKPLVDERVERIMREELLKNRRFQERLKARLETVGLDEELFGDAPQCAKRYDLFPLAFEAVRKAGGDGLWLEFGVYKGKTINYIGRQAPGKVYGFDSFEGLPDEWVQGRYRIAKQGKRHLHDKLPAVPPNVELVKGWFQDTLPGFLKEHSEPAAFVHVDSDLYESAAYVLERLNFRDGSVIVFDEYFNYPAWRDGEYKAFQEFLAKRPGVSAKCIGYCPTSNQAAFSLREI